MSLLSRSAPGVDCDQPAIALSTGWGLKSILVSMNLEREVKDIPLFKVGYLTLSRVSAGSEPA